MPDVYYVLFTLDVLPWEAGIEGKFTVEPSTIAAEFMYLIKEQHSDAFVDVSALDMACYENFDTYHARQPGEPAYMMNDTVISNMGSSLDNPLILVSPTRTDRLRKSNILSPHTLWAEAAHQAAILYEFDFDPSTGPTIEDLLYACEGEVEVDWKFRQAEKNHYRRKAREEYKLYRKGETFTSTPLPVQWSAENRKFMRDLKLAGLTHQ